MNYKYVTKPGKLNKQTYYWYFFLGGGEVGGKRFQVFGGFFLVWIYFENEENVVMETLIQIPSIWRICPKLRLALSKSIFLSARKLKIFLKNQKFKMFFQVPYRSYRPEMYP